MASKARWEGVGDDMRLIEVDGKPSTLDKLGSLMATQEDYYGVHAMLNQFRTDWTGTATYTFSSGEKVVMWRNELNYLRYIGTIEEPEPTRVVFAEDPEMCCEIPGHVDSDTNLKAIIAFARDRTDQCVASMDVGWNSDELLQTEYPGVVWQHKTSAPDGNSALYATLFKGESPGWAGYLHIVFV